MINRDRATILLIEEDDATRTFLADHLTADGFDMLVADCVRDGIRHLEASYPDLALIDVDLPDSSGLDLVSHVREADGVASRIDPQVPLMLLSARCGELDRVRGFERGADDVVEKPFSYRELRCRVEALLRRADPGRSGGRLRVADITESDDLLRGIVHMRDIFFQGFVRVRLRSRRIAPLRLQRLPCREHLRNRSAYNADAMIETEDPCNPWHLLQVFSVD